MVQLVIGEQIHGTAYRPLRQIGAGGMGSVYEVLHLQLGRLFVLKILHPHLVASEELVARMRNECQALARLNHPNIVQVTDAGETREGVPFFVMERLQGRNLGQFLSEQKRLVPAQVGPIMLDVLSGLAAAHSADAIHRDVKPQNIFVLESGRAKLLDFGIAKLKDSNARVVTAGGRSIGTPRYMAPEQAEAGVVDGRADIYAAGLVLYEMLTGRSPFAEIRDPAQLVLAHIGKEPLRADFVESSLAPEWGDLLVRWLAKNPADRPASAGAAAEELSALLASTPEQKPLSEEVTLGGLYDAATVGAPAADWLRRQETKEVRGPAASGGELLEPAHRQAQIHGDCEPTVTLGIAHEATARKRGTLRLGSWAEGARMWASAAEAGAGRERASWTPPPIVKSGKRWTARHRLSMAQKNGVVIVAAASLSFLLGWSALRLGDWEPQAGAAETREGAAETREGTSSGARTNKVAFEPQEQTQSATSRDEVIPLAVESARGAGLVGGTPKASPHAAAGAEAPPTSSQRISETGEQAATIGAGAPHPAQAPRSTMSDRGATPKGTSAMQPVSSQRQPTAAKSQRTTDEPAFRENAALRGDDEALPGSGLW